jgi:Caspase domain
MRKVAFLVGNDTFPKDRSIPQLRFTQNDAREFAAVLKDPETCGFETKLYLNRPSQEVLTGLEQISGELGQDDTLLFYYSGHGKLRGNELCLVSNESITASLGATSIRARLVLQYLQESLARRRILILDCCHSGAISSIYKAIDSKSTLDGLANSFGSYILTASTTIELAEEREKDGHGVFTKALIDCLREGPKERITINDLYEYAHSRLKISARQTPLFWALQQEGTAVEIGNYQARHERERRESLGQLIATASTRFDALHAIGVLTQGQVVSILRVLESDEASLFPHDRKFRSNLIRYLNGEMDFISVFLGVPVPRVSPDHSGIGHTSTSNQGQQGLPEPPVVPPITSPGPGKPLSAIVYDVAQLLSMSQKMLDDLFSTSDAGSIPDGQADGTAIIAPGTAYSAEIQTLITNFGWQGKVFDAKAGFLKNRITPFGLNAIIAKVYKAPSWLDGKECIVLDYSETSLVAHWIRDEIRLISPQFYLGKVYWDTKPLIDFSLKF